MLAETDELIGAESYVLKNAASKEVAQKFLKMVKWYKVCPVLLNANSVRIGLDGMGTLQKAIHLVEISSEDFTTLHSSHWVLL